MLAPLTNWPGAKSVFVVAECEGRCLLVQNLVSATAAHLLIIKKKTKKKKKRRCRSQENIILTHPSTSYHFSLCTWGLLLLFCEGEGRVPPWTSCHCVAGPTRRDKQQYTTTMQFGIASLPNMQGLCTAGVNSKNRHAHAGPSTFRSCHDRVI